MMCSPDANLLHYASEKVLSSILSDTNKFFWPVKPSFLALRISVLVSSESGDLALLGWMAVEEVIHKRRQKVRGRHALKKIQDPP